MAYGEGAYGEGVYGGGTPLSYSPEVLADLPLAYYRLDETSGAVLADASGNGHAGSLVGSPTLGQTSLVGDGTAVRFDGTSQYGLVPYASWMNPAGPFSVEAWFKIESTTGYKMLLIHSDFAFSISEPRYAWHVRVDGSRVHVGVGTDGGYGEWAGSTDLIPGQTYHAVLTWDGSNVLAFLNGELEIAATRAGTLNSGSGVDLYIGRDTSAGRQPSTVDEFALYPSALPPARVRAHYAAGGGQVAVSDDPYSLAVKADNPSDYWSLSFNHVHDEGSLADDMVLTGTPTMGQPGPRTGLTAYLWPANNPSLVYAASKSSRSYTTFTYELWVKFDANPSARTPLISSATAPQSEVGDKQLSLETDGRLRLDAYTGTYWQLFTTSSLTAGVWHHVVASIGAAGMKIRVDGVTIASNANTFADSTSAKILLHASAQGSGSTPGAVLMSGVALWQGAQLSDVQTDAHMSSDGAVTGALTATLPPLSGNLSGGIEFSGTIAATLPTLGANLAGTSLPPGVAGTISAVLPALSGDLAGTVTAPSYSGTLDALLPSLSANLAGQSFQPGLEGYIEALLPALSASLSGDVLGRSGLGLALDSSAVLTVEATLEPEPTVPPGTPPTVLHVIAPTVPVPTLVNGRPQ